MEPDANRSLGELIKGFRVARGLTQTELAAELNVSYRTIENLEENKIVYPRAFTYPKLYDALRLNPEQRALLDERLVDLVARTKRATRRRIATKFAVPAPVNPAERRLLERATERGGDTPEQGKPRQSVQELPASPGPIPSTLMAARPVGPLVGRDRELEMIHRRFREGARLLTLTGPGGIGKTRLALQAASVARAALGVDVETLVVPLEEVDDPVLIPWVIWRKLGVRTRTAHASRATLAATLAPRTVLLVLDHCDHIGTVVGELVQTLLGVAPRLRVLTTNRTALAVPGEQELPVKPLAFPAPDQGADPVAVSRAPSVQILLRSAHGASPTASIDSGIISEVVALCRDLAGLPLAIELVGAQWRAARVPGVRARLQEILGEAAPERDGLPHWERVTHAAIALSYDSLDLPERDLYAQLAVFAGAFAREDARAVCDADHVAVSRGLDRLTGAALLQVVVGDDGRTYYSLPLVIRADARERLDARGLELQEAQARHADHYCVLAEEAAVALRESVHGDWLVRLEMQVDNLRMALRRLCEAGELAVGLRLGAALWRFWYLAGYVHEGRYWLDRLLALPHIATVAPPIRAMALNGAGVLASQEAMSRQPGCGTRRA